MQHILIEANPEKGFNFPYVIFIPSNRNETENLGYKRYLLLEGYNSTYKNELIDDFEAHARTLTSQGYYGRVFQDALFVPRIMPLIPQVLFFDTQIYNVDRTTLKKTLDVEEYFDYLTVSPDAIIADTLFGYGYMMANLESYHGQVYPRAWYGTGQGIGNFLFDLMPDESLGNTMTCMGNI